MGMSKRSGLSQLESLFTTDLIVGGVLEGRYQKAIDTAGTGRIVSTVTSFLATSGAVALEAVGTNGLIVVPHYIKMTCTAVGTGTTQANYLLAVDPIARFSSGGTPLINNAVQPNSSYNSPSAGGQFAANRFTVGALTLNAAGGAVRQVSQGLMRTGIWVAGDEVYFDFFNIGTNMGLKSGTAASAFYIPVGPVALVPGPADTHSLALHVWHPGLTGAPSFMFEAGWWELRNPNIA